MAHTLALPSPAWGTHGVRPAAHRDLNSPPPPHAHTSSCCRFVGNATSSAFQAKLDFLSSARLLGCMGAEALRRLAPCFSHGVRRVRAADGARRQPCSTGSSCTSSTRYCFSLRCGACFGALNAPRADSHMPSVPLWAEARVGKCTTGMHACMHGSHASAACLLAAGCRCCSQAR